MATKKYRIFSVVFIGIVFLIGCGSYDDVKRPKMKIPQDAIAVSLYGERKVEDHRVFFQGWVTDTHQTVFVVSGDKELSYAYAYVLPEELVREIWGDEIPELYHFTPQNGYINVDEETTALFLVFISPPYFWMFTPRAIVYAAGYVVKHPKFRTLADKIADVEPGMLLSSERSYEIFALAHEIAGDVRELILPARLTPRMDAMEDDQDEEDQKPPEGVGAYSCILGATSKIKYHQYGVVKFVVRHMVFYGGGIMRGFDVSRKNPPVKHFVLKAQKGKIDLSVGAILSFNIINPKVETIVELPDPKGADYGIRIEKGIELSTSVFTDSIKRIGLVANLGRTVKYVLEVAVPTLAACVPDGEAWGWAVVQLQDRFPIIKQCEEFMQKLFSSKDWMGIVGTIAGQFLSGDSCVSRIKIVYDIIKCNFGPEFFIKKIAEVLVGFPLVLIWNALTKYIPFGIELFTRPRSGVFFVRDGAPFFNEIPILTAFQEKISSPGYLELDFLPYGCDRYNCTVRINCGEDKGLYERSFNTTRGACEHRLKLPLPTGFYGDNCVLSVVFNNQEEVYRRNITIENCPKCPKIVCQRGVCKEVKEGGVDGASGEESGGCRTTAPVSIYHIFAIFAIFLLRQFRKLNERNR